MKKLIALITLMASLTLQAQTTLPAPVGTNSTSLLPGGFGQLANDFGAFFTDATNYFGKGLRVGSYGLYNQAKWGGLVTAMYPINNNLSAGFGVAYLDHTFYDTSLGIQYGATWKAPLIGSIYTWVESGPAFDLHNHQALAQSFAGVTKDIKVSDWHLFVTGGVGNISTRPGQTYIAGFSVKPPGW